ncbi:MAG: DNA replication/repair protein RecF [Pseudomonadota bacterium]
MFLRRLVLRGLRNIEDLDLEPGPGVNWLIGPNASGKTSILEGVHILGLGRSFRARSLRRVVQGGRGRLVAYGEAAWHGGDHRLGVEGGEGETRLRRDGGDAGSIAELADCLPLQLVNPDSHRLVEGPPAERRALVDWGVFHVEPAFLRQWRRYRRVLEQRNAALRQGSGPAVARAWDQELIALGEAVDSARRRYLADLAPRAVATAGRHFGLEGLELSLHSGWARERTLADALEAGWEGDRRQGHTGSGPHRAELAIRVDGAAAAERVSRGQQKLLAAALRLAQLELFGERMGEGALLLLDDLPAELDEVHRQRLLAAVRELGIQALVTATEEGLVPEGEVDRRFRVEHGQARRVV